MQDSALEKALAKPLPARRTPPGDCLDDMQLARFVAGSLSADARLRATEHMALCDPCIERLRTVVELERESVHADPGFDDRATAQTPALPAPVAASRWRRGLPAAALVASLVVAAMGALLLSGRIGIEPSDSGNYREVRSASQAVAVPALFSPRDGTSLHRSELRFAWAALDSAVAYEVELLGGAGDILWQARSDGTEAVPPETLYLEPGATFYVWVRAHLKDGKTVKSQAASFRILEDR